MVEGATPEVIERPTRKTEDGDIDFLREGMKVLAQAVMEMEVTSKTGADRYERSEKRITSRNGYRPREWDTRVGTLDLQIPKLRQGSYARWMRPIPTYGWTPRTSRSERMGGS